MISLNKTKKIPEAKIGLGYLSLYTCAIIHPPLASTKWSKQHREYIKRN